MSPVVDDGLEDPTGGGGAPEELVTVQVRQLGNSAFGVALALGADVNAARGIWYRADSLVPA